MSETMSWSFTTKPEVKDTDLSPMVGRWQSGVDVQLIDPSSFNKGPVDSILSEDLTVLVKPAVLSGDDILLVCTKLDR